MLKNVPVNGNSKKTPHKTRLKKRQKHVFLVKNVCVNAPSKKTIEIGSQKQSKLRIFRPKKGPSLANAFKKSLRIPVLKCQKL